MKPTADIWLSIWQSALLLVSGNLGRVRQMSDSECVWQLTKLSAISIPLRDGAEADERSAALEQLRQRMSMASPSPASIAFKAVLEVIATGQATAKGRKSRDGFLEIIDPAEFVQMEFRAPDAANRMSGDILFYNVLISAHDLIELRKQVFNRASTNDTRPKPIGDSQSAHSSPHQSARRKPVVIWRTAREEAMRWLGDYGCPESGDGGQARLEKHIAEFLGGQDAHPTESTIRLHVVEWITDYRSSLATL